MGDFKPINQEFFENNVGGVEVSKTGKIKSKGVELSTLWKPKSSFNIGFDYNYNEIF